MKRINTRRIKAKLSYTIQELARLLNVHPNTILRWIEEGLPRIDGIYPYMIWGQDAIDFQKARQAKNKTKLALDEFHCCKCQASRKAWGGLADLKTHTSKTAMLKAFCERCSTPLNKLVSLRNRAEIEKTFALHTLPPETLVQSTNTNPYSETKGVDSHGQI